MRNPGQEFFVALRVDGRRHNLFRFARLYCDALPDFDRYLDELAFLTGLIKESPPDQQTVLKAALDDSESCVQFHTVTAGNLAEAQAQLAKARAALLPVADITRKYDVYYIGHSHIDMNWLWTWPETIDDLPSHMEQRDESDGPSFRNFDFVQSQPAAYVPIETNIRTNLRACRKMSAPGDGTWWEGCGMNRTRTSRAAKVWRGRFCWDRIISSRDSENMRVTGWLPDSFGHAWQLPQIMRLAGIRIFTTCAVATGMELTWWESPDGSRVLKANTRGV